MEDREDIIHPLVPSLLGRQAALRGDILSRDTTDIFGTRSKQFAKCPSKEMRWIAGWWFGCHEFYFPIYWVAHHPNWRTHIFQRGGWTTNQIVFGTGENKKINSGKWICDMSMVYSRGVETSSGTCSTSNHHLELRTSHSFWWFCLALQQTPQLFALRFTDNFLWVSMCFLTLNHCDFPYFPGSSMIFSTCAMVKSWMIYSFWDGNSSFNGDLCTWVLSRFQV